ncbi:MAG: acetyl-CoA acetyltransferase [Burkholderiales bacterium]|jgi:acetyl-CoA C-acetyltransferase|nr:acetyl-CoA acetyltransferase [Burkholderiales bacterium]
MRNASIVGWGHTPFGRLDGDDLESLILAAAREAIASAAIAPADIDAVFVGHFNAGMVPDGFVASLPMSLDPALRFKPAARLENACASGSAAIHAGLTAIESGRARAVLVVGAEKMTAVSGAEVTRALAGASYWREEGAEGLNFPRIFALFAQQYFARYGNHADTLARIAVKNHANGARNPLAHMRRALDFEFCSTVSERNPLIADPLRKTDCSTVADGAAALVLVRNDMLAHFPRAIAFRAASHVNDLLPMSQRDPLAFEGPRRAWADAYAEAGVRVDDLSFAEVHDCFTIAELLSYEAMGLAAPGQGHRVVDDGTVSPGGRVPVNPSGGLKAKGHPVGATGVSMHVMSAMQLTGTAGELQVPGAKLAGVFNMGGSAVANYVSILERTR